MALMEKFYHNPQDYDMVEHAMRNVQAILDSHRGHGSYLVDAGVVDLWFEKPTDQHFAQLEEQIRADLARFEPRVEITTFEPIEAGRRVRPGVRLRCRIRSNGVPIEIRYDQKGARLKRIG